MKKILLSYLFCCAIWALLPCNSYAFTQQKDPDYLTIQSPTTPPLHEIRAVWLTTIGGIDWPHSYSQSAASAKKQQEEFCNILDQLVEAGFNTVLLQTRVRATTIFQSDMEPWDGCLSGFPGKSPGYDALKFAIKECHKRGMKLHAWVVSIPIGRWNGAGCKALRNTCPNLIKKIGDEGFMNPEQSGTADYLARFCKDIVSRYDIDGIHLDYIRYPETWKVIKDRNQGRENITRIVRAVSNAVKQTKPWVMMSCSPVGKYADTKRMWSHGWNARDAVCQDAALWLKEGLMDALFPMMYFRGDNFYPFAIDWQERSAGKIICPGLGIYFMHPREKNWPLEDITREMHVLRQYGMGTCMFRSKFFTDNTKGIYDYTAKAFSPQPSLQPAMTWYDVALPAKPSALQLCTTESKEWLLSWNIENGKEGSLLQYNIYGSSTYPVDITNADNLLAANIIENKVLLPKTATVRYFAVTATDRYSNESEAAFIPELTPAEQESSGTDSALSPAFLNYDGTHVWLSKSGYGSSENSNTDASEGQLVVISSIMGNDLSSHFVKRLAGGLVIDVKGLTPGQYKVYVINKKGHRHLLGWVSVAL